MTNEIKTEVSNIVDSAAGAVKQLATTIDQWPISVLTVAVGVVVIVVIRGSTRLSNRFVVPIVIVIGMGMNAILGSVKSVPADQAYPTLVLAFKGLLLGFIACSIYMIGLKRFEKKLPFFSGTWETGEFRRTDIPELKDDAKDPKTKE